MIEGEGMRKKGPSSYDVLGRALEREKATSERLSLCVRMRLE